MVVIIVSMVVELCVKIDVLMMECKKVLMEVDGDLVKVEELLCVKFGNKVSKVVLCVMVEGVVVLFVGGNVGVLVELNCEIDFVVKNDDFFVFLKMVVEFVVMQNLVDVVVLLVLLFDGLIVDVVCFVLIGKIGENVLICCFVCFEIVNKIVMYLYGVCIGVIVEYMGVDEQVGKDVVMYIVVMKLVVLLLVDVLVELIEMECCVVEQKVVELGKLVEIVVKMVDGSVQKYLKEVLLLNQMFVKNDKQMIEQMLKVVNVVVQKFVLFVVGEGIEKCQDDFVVEVVV